MESTVTRILPCSQARYNEYLAKEWETEARMCETGAAVGFSLVHMAAGCRAIAQQLRDSNPSA